MTNLNKRFYLNNVYRTNKGKLVIFLGLQGSTLAKGGEVSKTTFQGTKPIVSKTHGFFCALENPNTFFGLPLNQIDFLYE
jgi:hypothetical protein